MRGFRPPMHGVAPTDEQFLPSMHSEAPTDAHCSPCGGGKQSVDTWLTASKHRGTVRRRAWARCATADAPAYSPGGRCTSKRAPPSSADVDTSSVPR
jgi:hypothetical protein